MKKWVCFLVLFLLSPLYAQKNLLPAAKAAFGKKAVQAVSGNRAAGVVRGAGSAQRTLEENAVHMAANRQSARNLPAAASQKSKWRAKNKQAAVLSTPVKLFVEMQNRPLEIIFQKPWTNMSAAERKRFNEFIDVLQKIEEVKTQEKRWNKIHSFERRFIHSNLYSSFMEQNNKITLFTLQNFIQKMQWLDQYPNQGRDMFAVESGRNIVQRLAERLKNEKMIMLGEYHFVSEIQQAVQELAIALKQQNPSRRVVLFTEFLNLPVCAEPAGLPAQAYYRRANAAELAPWSYEQINEDTYARGLFENLLKKQIEVYPLEDRTQYDLLKKASFNQMNLPLVTASRNKSWVRTIEAKMAQIRKTDPDALFIVYAGKGHVSWLSPYSLPKFFTNEKPVVVQVEIKLHAGINTLANIWGEKDPALQFPNRSALFSWEGKDARELAKNTGFDYLLVPSEQLLAKWKRIYEVFLRSH